MTPRDIISKEILKIPKMRIPFAALIVARIFETFEEYGYTVVERPAGESTNEKRNGNR